MPSPKASASAIAISSMLTLVMFSRKLDLKMSLNVMIYYLLYFSLECI